MRRALLCLFGLTLACKHVGNGPGAATAKAEPGSRAAAEPAVDAAQLSEETHALLRAEGELLWKRWTTGAGPLPASAIAEHPKLSQKDALDAVGLAIAKTASASDEKALHLLHAQLATLALAREALPETEALDRARAALAYAAPGEARGEHGERDLDRLLTDEASAPRRAAIALAEAQAAQPLGPLTIAREEAMAKAFARLGLGRWQDLFEEQHQLPVADLAALAEQTLQATDAVAARAVAGTAQRNLGITADRLRRADLPRLVRSSSADASFPAGQALPRARATLGTLPPLAIDAEPLSSKAARPLALLVDPPSDVRLSLKPAGGFEEQRATLHETARATGGALTQAPRWELAQLGDGSQAEGIAQLFEELSGDPGWLREQTQLRGEPLDDLVHTQATRRLLAARRAAALVLFELQRREGPQTAEAAAALYRGLLQRATLSVLTDEDAARWALEADPFVRAAVALEGAVLAAQLQLAFAATGGAAAPSAAAVPTAAVVPSAAAITTATETSTPTAAGTAPAVWWHAPPPLLRQLWSQGRSATAADAARALGAAGLDPTALATVAEAQLSYRAPEAPPPAQRPDYKYMQGDRRTRRKKHRKH